MEFAVVDLETTGMNAGKYDRIVELAVVHVDEDGEISGVWETLLNPDRDLGPQSIHGIHASDVLRAPRFEEIAGDLVELLRNRVVVAHNASFDCRFLEAEFARLGAHLTVADRALCTLQLARRLLPGMGRSLAACCAALDLDLEDAHHAKGDAVATARLLSTLLRMPAARNVVASNNALTAWPNVSRMGVAWHPRPETGRRVVPFLEKLVEDLPYHAGPESHDEYLGLLDRCLLDRRLTEHEVDELVAAARDLGLDRARCAQLHGLYFDHLAAAAWADGVVTDAERKDLIAVATLLSIDDGQLQRALASPALETTPAGKEIGRFRLAPGDRVVLTGDMQVSRAEWHERLLASGLVPAGAVNRAVKVLAAADPDSLSGKAKRAREYGIPIVDEAGLVTLLEAYRQRR